MSIDIKHARLDSENLDVEHLKLRAWIRVLAREVDRLRKALTRADSTIVWFEMRKAASEALLAVAEEILTERDRVAANIRLRDAVAECRREELK